MPVYSRIRRWVAGLISLCAVPTALHAEAPSEPAVGGGAHLLNVALGLVLIVVLILALAWVLRRFGQGGVFSNQKAIKIVAAMPMGTRERLLVVDVGGQQLLLGVTAREINTLHVFDTPVIDPDQPAQQSDFGRKLMAVLQNKERESKKGENQEQENKDAGGDR